MPLQEESAAQALAPSEAVILNGNQFATPVPKPTGLHWIVPHGTTLLHRDITVSRSELIVAAISVALLVTERNGEVKLTVRQGGNRSARQDRLIIMQGTAAGQWPQGSLEARIGSALARRSTTLFTGNTVADLIVLIVDWKFWQTLIVSRYAEPYLLNQMVKALVKRGLADRIPGDGKLLGIIPYRRASAHLSEAGQRVVAHYDLKEVRQLLFQCKRKRPDIWSLLEDEIVRGLARADSAD